ncbi:MAG: glycerophosphodiester phosphodiesterase family protein [Alphaproteobacteria bacterium]|nr:glycerophosphodiester phosphodiesterase family protein [Alphaproteobacteria bacterium]
MDVQHIDFTPPVIAHRGAPLCAPENSLESFIAAHQAGSRWVEADVKLTSDGIPIVFHDDTLERTTSGSGTVADTPWSIIQRLDAGSWFSPTFSKVRVLTLFDLLSFCAKTSMRLVLELRPSPGRTRATAMVALIEASKSWGEETPPPLVSSFDMDALMIAAQLRPDWPRSLFLNEWDDNWLSMAILTQASALSFNETVLTPERLERINAAPFPILAHTVNNPSRAKELLGQGIKAVFSDNVSALLAS